MTCRQALVMDPGWGSISLMWIRQDPDSPTGYIACSDRPSVEFRGLPGPHLPEAEALPTYRAVMSRPSASRTEGVALPGCHSIVWCLGSGEWEAIEAEARAYLAARERRDAPPELPPEARELVRRYGSAEAAWEAEDETAWAVLRRWGY